MQSAPLHSCMLEQLLHQAAQELRQRIFGVSPGASLSSRPSAERDVVTSLLPGAACSSKAGLYAVQTLCRLWLKAARHQLSWASK